MTPCKVVNQSNIHFIRRFYERGVDHYLDAQELTKRVEDNFNTGKRETNTHAGLRGERYKIAIESYKWGDKIFTVIVEQIAQCTLMLITVL